MLYYSYLPLALEDIYFLEYKQSITVDFNKISKENLEKDISP